MHSTISAQDITPEPIYPKGGKAQIAIAAALTVAFTGIAAGAKDPKVPMIFTAGCSALTMGLVIGKDREARKPREL